MTLELLKVVVQPVLIERDPDGRIVGEQIGEPAAIYDLAQLADYIEAVRNQLIAQQDINSNNDGREASSVLP